mmetsp:Transcript_31837/g.46952  ORF Transcript_31837/g.46952 Transcript_31837/m.46952 type:complete len:197 (-) Transcript_31837:1799-2389(-)
MLVDEHNCDQSSHPETYDAGRTNTQQSHIEDNSHLCENNSISEPANLPTLSPEENANHGLVDNADVGAVVGKAKKAAQFLWLLIHAQVSERVTSTTREIQHLFHSRIVTLAVTDVHIKVAQRPRKYFCISKLVPLKLEEKIVLLIIAGATRQGNSYLTIQNAVKYEPNKQVWGVARIKNNMHVSFVHLLPGTQKQC